MRGYYLHYRDIEDSNLEFNGVDLKVRDQINALNELGMNCSFVFCDQPTSLIGMAKACMPFLSDGVSWPDASRFVDADYVYIRKPRFASRELLSFVRSVKEMNPRVKILYELFTYPYDSEMSTVKLFAALVKDKKNRGSLKKHVDRIVDLSGAGEIFGIKTIQMMNGIDLDRVSRKRPADESDCINVMCAAFYSPTHGIDRFLNGMAEYRDSGGSRELILHLAGGGSELSRLKRIVKSRGLEDRVTFYGPLDSESLDDLYGKCTLALGVLGLFRIGADSTSALKTREYLAKGMPFVYGGGVDVLDKYPVDFCMRVSNCDEPIDVGKVIDFHDRLYSRMSQQDVIDLIRGYAEENVGMQVAMSDVVRYINGD